MTDTPPLPPAIARLDRQAALPAYRQLYERIRDAVLAGDLAPGTRLPSTRSLASQIAVARGTVDTAYAMLAGEGYILGRGPAGNLVAPTVDACGAPAVRRTATAVPTVPATPSAPPGSLRSFQLGLPAIDAFPRKVWARIAARHARSLTRNTMAYPDWQGLPALREEIASYLRVSRGIACTPDALFITAGFQGALGLIALAAAEPGDAVWVESPGYFKAAHALRQAGLTLVPVPVDAEGLVVEAGRAQAPAARFAMVTPTHQFPLGHPLSLARRTALLRWAGEAGAYVIEDDYDSEYQYGGPRLPALKSIDADGRVIYAGSFSKVLFPGLRLGYLVVPAPLTARFAMACEVLMPSGAALDQAVVADFLREGHFSRHVKRMRTLYAERRGALAEALDRAFAGLGRVQGDRGGMHLLLHLDAGVSDLEAAARAGAAGMAPSPLSVCSPERSPGHSPGRDAAPGLLLGFTNIPAADAAHAAERLRRAVEGVG